MPIQFLVATSSFTAIGTDQSETTLSVCPVKYNQQMPIVFTYDLAQAKANTHNRIQSLFERLGWEGLGGSAFRYPRLGTDDQPVEDWLNHVIPALMLFRLYCLQNPGLLKKCTLDAQSSSGFNPVTQFGNPPLSGDALRAAGKLYPPKNVSFGEKNLVDWLDSTTFPY